MKKAILRFTLMLILILFSFCTSNNSNNMKWKTFDFLKLPGETRYMGFASAISNYDINQCLIVDYKKLILIGNNGPKSRREDLSKNCDAVVFTSQDGGEIIEKKIIGKGECDRAFFYDGEYYITVRNGEKGWSSYLVKSDIEFNNFEVIGKYNQVNIDNLYFYNNQIGVASFFSNYKGSVEYKYTLDGGKSWNIIPNPFKEDYRIIRIVSDSEVEALYKNQLMKLNFKTGEETILYSNIFPEKYQIQDYIYVSQSKQRLYVYLKPDEKPDELSIKFLDNNEIIELPKRVFSINIYGDYLQTMVKDGPWYNYIYSKDGGKTWNVEKLRDFFVVPNPIACYGQGMVVSEIIDFKRKFGEERETYIGIRQMDK